MGWKTARSKKGCSERHRSSSSARGNSKRRSTSSYRSNDQQLVNRLLLEANGAVEAGALESVFGSEFPAYALRVALRIKQIKKRDEVFFSEEQRDVDVASRRRLRERNMHHLTPKCRKGQPFFGNNPHNILLMKISRHDALHEAFGVKTWEEIIALLSRCVAAIHRMDFDAMIDLIQRAFKKSGRRKARRALRNLQLGFCPGIFRGSFFVGMQGIEPCLTAPKAVVLPVYDIPFIIGSAHRAPSEPL